MSDNEQEFEVTSTSNQQAALPDTYSQPSNWACPCEDDPYYGCDGSWCSEW